MTKAELEVQHVQYHACLQSARAAEEKSDYRGAIEHALQSWAYLGGMIQYERKYEDAIEVNFDTIDLVLRYAPLILHLESLEQLESLLKSQRRISKNASEDLPDNISEAMDLLWKAHSLWDLLEREPELRQDELRRILGGDQDRWRWLAEAWERMGLVQRTPDRNSYVLSLITRMDRVTKAKCPNCGGVGRASRTKLLHAKECPGCKQPVSFVFIAEAV